MSLKHDVQDTLMFEVIMRGSDWLASRVTPRGRGCAVTPAREASDDLFAETPAQETARRLRAVELHLVDLEERLTDRGVFSG